MKIPDRLFDQNFSTSFRPILKCSEIDFTIEKLKN